MPRLLIQPLVENAIRHGRDEEGKCVIKINAQREEGKLQIRIRDRGRLVEEEKLEELRLLLEQDKNRKGHVGLYNVHKRVRLSYGKPYGLTMTAEPEGGMCFCLTLPEGEGELEDAQGIDCRG